MVVNLAYYCMVSGMPRLRSFPAVVGFRWLLLALAVVGLWRTW
jgi:hypothetical protein